MKGCQALLVEVLTRFYVSPGKNCHDVVGFLRIVVPGVGQGPAKTELTIFVESKNQQTVVLLRPAIVAVDVVPQPPVASPDSRRNRTVVHVVYKVRDNKRNGGQRIVIRGKFLRKSQV